MKKLILHIGYPKTATSTLQKNVLIPLHQKQQLNYLGEETNSGMGELHHDSKFVKNIILGGPDEIKFAHCVPSDTLEHYRDNGIDPARRLARSKGFLRSFLREEMINVISFETVLMPYRAVTVWIDFPRKLRDALPTDTTDVQIVITLRNQAALMESLFFEKSQGIYLRSTFSSPSQFYFKERTEATLRDCEQVNIFDFHTTLEAYENIFGKENIHILFYEDIQTSPADYFSKWASLLDISTSDFSELFNGAPKSRVTPAGKDYFKLKVSLFDYFLRTMFISKHTERADGHGKPLMVRMIDACKRLPFASRLNLNMKIPRLTQSERDAIYQHFKQSNSEIARDYDLDTVKMKDYGYL